jgi:hypothetical protein
MKPCEGCIKLAHDLRTAEKTIAKLRGELAAARRELARLKGHS